MKRHHHLLGLILVMGLSAQAWGQEASCQEIRAAIAAHVGLVAKPNIELLSKISGRSECQFTAAEVYRAAYADNPVPPRSEENRQRTERDGHEHGDHDD